MLISGLVFLSNVYADTLVVPTHYDTIQEAIDAANAGDTVVVLAGTYQINSPIIIDKNITLRSYRGPQETVIETVAVMNYAIFIESGLTRETRLEGFTIESTAYGIFIDNASPIISNNILYGSGVADGISAWGSYGAPEQPQALIRNNIISGFGTGIYNPWSLPEVINTTITANLIGVNCFTPSFVIKNSIIYDNLYGSIVVEDPLITYSDIEGGFAGIGNIDSDPLFVDWANRDYRLRPSSPCRDAGDPDPQYNDPNGSRNDMGAYGGPNAYVVEPLITIIYPENGQIIPTGNNEPITWVTADCIGSGENLRLMILQTYDNDRTEVVLDEDIPNTGTYELPEGLLEPGIPYNLVLSVSDSVKFGIGESGTGELDLLSSPIWTISEK